MDNAYFRLAIGVVCNAKFVPFGANFLFYKEKIMKKLFTLLLTICLVLCSTFAISCNKGGSVKATLVSVSEHTIVIKVEEVSGNPMLIEVLENLKGDNFNYKIVGGMITEINGVENPADWSYCWMIYTNDADFSNSAWGLTHNGEEFGSAILGAESLPVTANCLYILNYTYFPPN